MNKIFLITRPKHDDTTHYLFNWSKETIELAEKKGVKILDLKKEKANKKVLTSFINKRAPSLIFFNGHGGDNCVMGHSNEVSESSGDSVYVRYLLWDMRHQVCLGDQEAVF